MASVFRQKLMSNTTNWHIRVSIKPKWLFGGGRSGHTRQGLPSYPSQRNVRSHDPDTLMLKENLNVHNNDPRTRLIPRFSPFMKAPFRVRASLVFSAIQIVWVCVVLGSLWRRLIKTLHRQHSQLNFPVPGRHPVFVTRVKPQWHTARQLYCTATCRLMRGPRCMYQLCAQHCIKEL